MMQITPTVKQLLIINILFYIGSQIVGEPAYDYLSLFYFNSPKFHYWQPLTHMFMHAQLPNIMHILFNMFALYSFGSALEHFWGGKKFLFFYISCGLGGALLHSLVNHWHIEQGIAMLQQAHVSQSDILYFLREGRYDEKLLDTIPLDTLRSTYLAYNVPAVGASGAIYGLLVAFAFMFPNAQLAMMFIPVPIKAKYFVPAIFFLLDVLPAFTGTSLLGDSVAHFAHIGGAVIGFLMMWFWRKKEAGRQRWN